MTKPSITFRPAPDLVAESLRRAGRVHWGRHERLRRILAGGVLGLLALLLVARYDWQVWGLSILRWQEVAGFALAGAAAGWYLGRAPARLAAGDPRLGPQTVSVADDGLRVAMRGQRLVVDWTSVATISESGGVIRFVTDWGEIHFVPREAFAAPAAADAFLAAARDARRRAGDGGAPRATGAMEQP